MADERKRVVSVTRDSTQISISVLGHEAQPIVLRFSDCSDAVRQEAMGYGMEVRLTRQAALERNEKTGASASPLDKYNAIRELAEHYATGTEEWKLASGNRVTQDTRDLAAALSAALGLDEESALRQTVALTADERAALRVDPDVKPHLDAILSRRSASVDTKSLLSKLKGG